MQLQAVVLLEDVAYQYCLDIQFAPLLDDFVELSRSNFGRHLHLQPRQVREAIEETSAQAIA